MPVCVQRPTCPVCRYYLPHYSPSSPSVTTPLEEGDITIVEYLEQSDPVEPTNQDHEQPSADAEGSDDLNLAVEPVNNVAEQLDSFHIENAEFVESEI